MNEKKNDKLIDWYKFTEKIPTIKPDKHFNSHLIKPCSMISVIGQTGSGKSSFLVEFLARKPNSFFEIIIFNPVLTDEPLYNLLKSKIAGIKFIDDVADLPELSSFKDEDKNEEKLIVFDDIINLKVKEKQKIQKFYCSARKFGFTCINLSQNFTDIPIQIRRNTQIYILFRLNDINSINQILKTHNHLGIPKELIKRMYLFSTQKKKDFFKIDFTSEEAFAYSHNFIDILNPMDFVG